jgi:hypothetical protein
MKERGAHFAISAESRIVKSKPNTVSIFCHGRRARVSLFPQVDAKTSSQRLKSSDKDYARACTVPVACKLYCETDAAQGDRAAVEFHHDLSRAVRLVPMPIQGAGPPPQRRTGRKEK